MPRHTASCLLLSSFIASTLRSASLLFLLASCSSPTPPPVPTEAPPPTSTVPPTDAPPPTVTFTPSPTPQPALARPQYTINIRLDYTTRTARVDQVIVYPNWTGETLNNLVLAVEPNLWSGGFSLKSLAVNEQPITSYTLEGQKLDLSLPQPLHPSETITLTMNYGLILPKMPRYSDQNDVRPQIYGYTERQINLVDWYPFVVPYISGNGWVLHNPWFYGEHLVYDAADFDVTLTFTDGSTPQVAASGAEIESGSADSRRFVLEAGRTFAFSTSTLFKVASAQVGDVTVFSYYFGFYDDPGLALLHTTARSLEAYTGRFGPYRHKTLTAVQGDFNDGMEFSGLYFISRDYFNLYDYTPKNYLVIIAAHETAHQWWFDAVANDQGLEPWLDEALSTYSERVYYETYHPDEVQWWWGYRYFEFKNDGFVDTQVYEGGGQRPYWDKVYLTGARFLEELRERIGDEDFFAFLADYYSQYAGKRASTQDFFRVLREHTALDISDLISKYFQNTY